MSWDFEEVIRFDVIMSIEVLRRIIVKQKQREEEKRVSRFDLANRGLEK